MVLSTLQQQNLEQDGCDLITIRRDSLLIDAIKAFSRSSFNPKKWIKVNVFISVCQLH